MGIKLFTFCTYQQTRGDYPQNCPHLFTLLFHTTVFYYLLFTIYSSSFFIRISTPSSEATAILKKEKI